MLRSCEWNSRYVVSRHWSSVEVLVIVGLAAMLSREYQNNQFMRQWVRRILACGFLFEWLFCDGGGWDAGWYRVG